MKIDNDPIENREKFDKFRSFSAKSMLITRKGFWLFFGFMFVIASPIIYFGGPSTVPVGDRGEAALKSFSLGFTIMLFTLIISYLLRRIGEYTPKKNKGNEWLQ